MAALAVFAAQGLRITSEPGHHQVALEGLTETEGWIAANYVDMLKP